MSREEPRATQIWWRSIGVFVVAVVLITGAFVTAALVPLFRAHEISDAARGIRENAVPSIRALVGARTEIVLLERRIERYVAGPPDPGLRHEIRRAVQRLHGQIAVYRSLPTYPGEREQWNELEQSVDRLTVSTDEILLAHDRQQSTRRLLEAFERDAAQASEVLRVNVSINAEQIQAFAQRIEAARRTAWRDALLLSAICIALTVLLLSLAWASARRQGAAERKYAALLEERAAEMDLFSGRVAHDILSPLTSLSLVLGQLAGSEDERVRRLANRGLSGLERSRSTVDGLLEFARAGVRPSVGALCDIAAVASATLAELEEHASAGGTELRLEVEGRPGCVNANRGVVTSVITNLVQNALKHASGAPITARVIDENRSIRVEVADRGPGLDPALRDRIFEPYFRAPGATATGLGLGLATVKRLVEAHGGRVGVRARSGGGSVFWFELPKAGPAGEAEAAASVLHPAP
jgi:signal transduction histidine kinase